MSTVHGVVKHRTMAALIDSEYESIKADATASGPEGYLPKTIPASMRAVMIAHALHVESEGASSNYAALLEVEDYEEACLNAWLRERRGQG